MLNAWEYPFLIWNNDFSSYALIWLWHMWIEPSLNWKKTQWSNRFADTLSYADWSNSNYVILTMTLTTGGGGDDDDVSVDCVWEMRHCPEINKQPYQNPVEWFVRWNLIRINDGSAFEYVSSATTSVTFKWHIIRCHAKRCKGWGTLIKATTPHNNFKTNKWKKKTPDMCRAHSIFTNPFA